MIIPVWNSRTDLYEKMELDVALKDKDIFCFHPLADSQPSVDCAIEDSKYQRNPMMLADALFEELTRKHHWNDRQLKEFIKRFFVLMFPAGHNKED